MIDHRKKSSTVSVPTITTRNNSNNGSLTVTGELKHVGVQERRILYCSDSLLAQDDLGRTALHLVVEKIKRHGTNHAHLEETWQFFQDFTLACPEAARVVDCDGNTPLVSILVAPRGPRSSTIENFIFRVAKLMLSVCPEAATRHRKSPRSWRIQAYPRPIHNLQPIVQSVDSKQTALYFALLNGRSLELVLLLIRQCRQLNDPVCASIVSPYHEVALHIAISTRAPLSIVYHVANSCPEAVIEEDVFGLSSLDWLWIRHVLDWHTSPLDVSSSRIISRRRFLPNSFLDWHCDDPVDLIQAECRHAIGEKVRTPYGLAIVREFDPLYDLYKVELDWRPLHVQVEEYLEEVKSASIRPKKTTALPVLRGQSEAIHLETVEEADEGREDEPAGAESRTVIKKAYSTLDEISDDAADDSSISTWDSTSIAPVQTSAEQSIGESSQEGGQPSAEIPTQQKHILSSRSQSSGALEVNSQSMQSPRSPRDSQSSFSTTSDPLLRHADEEQLQENSKEKSRSGFVYASVSGRFITKHTAPSLPKLSEKARGSIFPFLQTPKPITFNKGDECTTPYGPARVIEFREKKGFVVVEMVNWHATAYLKKEVVKHVSHSLFSKLVRQLSLADKPVKFPHADGTIISTPFGKGRVFRPIPVSRPSSKKIQAQSTLGLRLENWKLSDGTHPILYCTVEAATLWKEKKVERPSIITSALGKMVESSRTLLSPLLLMTPKQVETPKLFTRYYQNCASVSTMFGDGRIKCFRPSDGVYEVSLLQCKLANGSYATAYLRQNDIYHRLAKGCQEGK
jgi:hypothetical protein